MMWHASPQKRFVPVASTATTPNTVISEKTMTLHLTRRRFQALLIHPGMVRGFLCVSD
jgi:hypothetical protein